MEIPDLPEFFAVLRSQDDQKVEAMFRLICPPLRQAVRLRLADGRLSHIADLTDILNSLMLNFLRREGVPAPGEPTGSLLAYLTQAACNKIRTKWRKERHYQGFLPDGWDQPVSADSTSEMVEVKDYLDELRTRLPVSIWPLFDLLAQGFTWPEIAERLGGNPDTLRMRLRRALIRVLPTSVPLEPSDDE